MCINGRCKEGWGPPPVCDQGRRLALVLLLRLPALARTSCTDIDECAAPDACPPTLPNCINTQGAFVCTCSRGYDNDTGLCIGSLRTFPNALRMLSHENTSKQCLKQEFLTGSTLEHNNINGTPQFVEVVPIQPQVVTPRLVGGGISIPQRPPQSTVSFQTPPPQQVPVSVTNTLRDVLAMIDTLQASSRITLHQLPPGFPTQPPPSHTTPRQRISSLFTRRRFERDAVQKNTLLVAFSPTTRAPIADIDCGCGADAHCERIPPHGQSQCVCNTGFSGDGHFCVGK